MYLNEDGERGQWAGFEKEEWRKSGLRSMLRGRSGVRKTLDVTTFLRTGERASAWICGENSCSAVLSGHTNRMSELPAAALQRCACLSVEHTPLSPTYLLHCRLEAPVC